MVLAAIGQKRSIDRRSRTMSDREDYVDLFRRDSAMPEQIPTKLAKTSMSKTDYVDRLSRRVGGWLIFITILGTASIIGTVTVYQVFLGGPVSYDDEHWARFGEFAGGALNPLLSFLAFLALVITLWVQIQAMRLSRIGLEDARQEIARQQCAAAEMDANKRNFVFCLLHDEIKYRWQQRISVDLEEIANLSKSDPLKAANVLCNDVESSLDDLIVCKIVGTTFPDFYFLNDPRLMSEIIHGHVLMRDFVDFRVALKRDLDAGNYEEIKEYLNLTFVPLLQKMNDRYESIAAKLS